MNTRHTKPVILILLTLTWFITQAAWATPTREQFLNSDPKPEPPTETAPGQGPSQHIQTDISKYPAQQLDQYAVQAYRAKDYEKAIQYQYWAIQNGDDSYYDLACNYALAGQVDQAIHWLYVHAREGSVDVLWTDQDPDLKAVREHPEWPRLRQHLVHTEIHWRHSGNKAYTAIVPDDYEPNTPIPLAVGLHGKGDTPLDFIHDGYQELANTMGIAVIGLSGPVPLGENSYAWTTNWKQNDQHLTNFLSEALERENINPSSTALFGFSQGAQVSLQTAALHPDDWEGVLAMSPGLYPVESLTIRDSSHDYSDITFIVTNGAEEGEYNLNLAKQGIAALEKQQAKVQHKVYPGQGHQFPGDYYQMLGTWMQAALKLKPQ